MYTRNYKRIKTRIHITICLYGKGNEIISQRLFYLGSCLVLNDNCHCMRCCWNTLHLIWVNRINMTIFANVRKLFLVMTISIHLRVWWQKKWKTSLCTWTSLFDVIIATISWNVSWVIVRLVPHTQRKKWIPKSSMVRSHWHHEKCTIIGCVILRQIQSLVRKWTKDKQNKGVMN